MSLDRPRWLSEVDSRVRQQLSEYHENASIRVEFDCPMNTLTTESMTLILRPTRFLTDVETSLSGREFIIVKDLPLTQKTGSHHHLIYGVLSRTSGKCGSQIMLTRALDLTLEMDLTELKCHYHSDIRLAKPLCGRYVDELVAFLRGCDDVRFPRQSSLWINLGYDCFTYVVERGLADDWKGETVQIDRKW